MKTQYLSTFTLVALFAANAPAIAAKWLEPGATAKTPAGHYYYCKRGGQHCGAHQEAAPALMDRKKWGQVKAINVAVNRAIEPATDLQTRGVEEYWEQATKRGDCEDYALLKRSKLLAAGFKPSQLPLAKTRLRNGEAHIILVLRTSDGDFALDNLTNKIKPVTRTSLRFLTMQSAQNASRWVKITGYSTKPLR